MNPRIESAFKAVPRKLFLPAELTSRVNIDTPIPIGFGQTNSQPSTVAMMLEWLDVKPRHNVLDVGSGSGWTSALLAWLVAPGGNVEAVELIPELVELGEANAQRAGITNANFNVAHTDIIGWPEKAPYDRILVSASANEFPNELIDQLTDSGKLVIPIKHSIWEVTKDKKGEINTIQHPGFAFVPLVR